MSVMAPHPAVKPAGLVEEAGPHRFTLEEYLRLSEAGLLDGRRTEFIDGEILDMASQKDPHTIGVTQSMLWAAGAFPPARHWIRVQSTLLAAGSAPEPDLAVMNYSIAGATDYARAENALLVVEIADSTLLADTTVKPAIYAAAGVKDYWVLSIPDRALIVHRQLVESAGAKHGWAYAEVRRISTGQTVFPLAAPSAMVDPADWLP